MANELDANLQPPELAALLVSQINAGLDYADKLQRKYQRSSSIVRVTGLVLSAASAVILGLQDLNFWANLAFSMITLTTLVATIEAFFNWRSRWVSMEEMSSRFHLLENEIKYFVARTDPRHLDHDSLEPFFQKYQEIWASTSRLWLEARRGDHSTAWTATTS